MKTSDCSNRAELVEAVRRDAVSAELQSHVDQCEDCRDTARIVGKLAALATETKTVPSFAHLMWRVQAREILETSSRRRAQATRPLQIFHLAVGVAALTAAILVGVGPLLLPSALGNLGGLGFLVAAAVAATGGSQINLARTGSPWSTRAG